VTHDEPYLHPSYASLNYVLLFPHGEDGWHINIPSQPGIMVRQEVPKLAKEAIMHTTLFWGGELLQQYTVDVWSSIEQSNLNWVRHHQKKLRTNIYQGLKNAAVGNRDENMNLEQNGKHIILPLSHAGSKRQMNQLFQDSMAICWAFKKPDIFLTMTANAAWDEINEALLNRLLLIGQILLLGSLKKRKRLFTRRSEKDYLAKWLLWSIP